MDGKIAINAKIGRPMMKTLARGKRLRGMALDPFGQTGLRRAERAVVGEYIALLDALADQLNIDELPWATSVAGSAMDVRGYEELKMERLELFRAKMSAARSRLDQIRA